MGGNVVETITTAARTSDKPLYVAWVGAPDRSTASSRTRGAIEAIARLAEALGDDLLAMEINPLIVHQQADGAHAADALVVLRSPLSTGHPY